MIKLRRFIELLREVKSVPDRQAEKLVDRGDAAMEERQALLAASCYVDAFSILAREHSDVYYPLQYSIAQKIIVAYSMTEDVSELHFWTEKVEELKREIFK